MQMAWRVDGIALRECSSDFCCFPNKVGDEGIP